MLAERGICVSYDRLRQLSIDIAKSVIAHWEHEGVVVPHQASKGIFTTGGVDNIDYNPSSTTASPQSVLQDTSISILQHYSSDQELIKEVAILDQAVMGQKNVNTLPASYTLMEEAPFHKEDQAFVPLHEDINTHPIVVARWIQEVLEDGYQWLDNVSHHIENELARDEWISWAAYHAARSDPPSFRTNSYMLPLLRESANSPVTMLHCMSTIRRATAYLNPGQTPIMVADQPLYTLSKRLHWNFVIHILVKTNSWSCLESWSTRWR